MIDTNISIKYIACIFPEQKKAIITIAPKSSIIAKAVKKTFREIGTLFPSKDNTPKENAISVADGIAHPFRVSEFPKLIAT